MVTFTFDDGTTITGLETTDYIWYVSNVELNTELLSSNVFLVTITDGENTSLIGNQTLAESKTENGKYYYRLHEKTDADDVTSMMIDHEYRLTLLELGI